MSDYQDDRLLSRRERRLRELGDTSGIPTVAGASAADPAAVGAFDEEEIVISLVDENGRARTRREMRELREQALAERAAQAAAAAELRESTQADAAEAEEPADDTQPIDAVRSQPRAGADAPESAEEPAAIEEAGATEGAEEAEPEAGELDPHLVHTQPFTPEDLAEATADAGDPESDQIDDGNEADDEAGDVAEAEAEDAAEAAPVSATKQTYTFPDIAPLDEGISVFDDPALRTLKGTGAAAENSDFDDLISRAVAQEGAASAANTSALILPSMPETSDLSGPLGETGELYITGSIELPRSLGETGGHSALLDSIESDPLDEMGFGEQPASGGGIAPVSAARAVSARANLGPVVTEAQKEKSKLPVVLIATGGGLVVAVVALLVWGATSGMFG